MAVIPYFAGVDIYKMHHHVFGPLLTLSALSVVEQPCGIPTRKLATEERYLVFSGPVVTPEECQPC